MDQDTDTIHLALALLGQALAGAPYTGPLTHLQVDVPALRETSPLLIRDALPQITLNRLAKLADDIDWTGYTTDPATSHGDPMYSDHVTIHVPADDADRARQHWAEVVHRLPPATLEIGGFWATATGPEDSGPHSAKELTRFATREVNTTAGWFESGDVPRIEPEPHTPGVTERGRRSPHGPISYDGPPLRRLAEQAARPGPVKADDYGPGEDWRDALDDRRFQWAQHTADARPTKLTAHSPEPISMDAQPETIDEFGAQFGIHPGLSADADAARRRTPASRRRTLRNRLRMRAARWVAGVPITVRDDEQDDR